MFTDVLTGIFHGPECPNCSKTKLLENKKNVLMKNYICMPCRDLAPTKESTMPHKYSTLVSK